jgi:hypothetical protein
MSSVHTSPFFLPTYVDQPIKGLWNWEKPPAGYDGPFQYAGQQRTIAPYSGMEQTSVIVVANPKPPNNLLPSAAPPALSQIK